MAKEKRNIIVMQDRGSGSNTGLIIGGILLLVGIGGLAYYFFTKKSSSPTTSTTGSGGGVSGTSGPIYEVQGLTSSYSTDQDRLFISFQVKNNTNAVIGGIHAEILVNINNWPDRNLDTNCGSDVTSTNGCFVTFGMPPIPILGPGAVSPYTLNVELNILDFIATPKTVTVILHGPDDSVVSQKSVAIIIA